MGLAPLQKAAAQAIVNIFETGSVRGNYGDVTLLPGDSGQLTYGRSQTTLASGNLFLLIQAYCARNDGAFSAAMEPYLPKLEARDPSLNNDFSFRGMLKDAGDDPVMRDVQDAFFDRVYWEPAVRSAEVLGAETALGTAIVYDSTVHGSWARVRDLTRQRYGELADIGEDAWMPYYVDTRRDWLASFPNPLLHKTVYRMDAFKPIITAGNWKLSVPLLVRGQTITADALTSTVPVNIPAETAPRRLLRLKSPPMTGDDILWLQQRLTQAGFKVAESGTFDKETDEAVRAFQQAHAVKPDGVVGPVTRTALEDLPLTPQFKTNTVSEPMPAVAVPPPAITAPIETPTQEPAMVPSPAETAELKQHVSLEMQSAVQKIQGSIQDEHSKISDKIQDEHKQIADKLITPETFSSLLQRVATGTQGSRKLVANYVLKGHPAWAAGLSAVMLALTEARDAIAWVDAGPISKIVKPLIPTNLPALPQSFADVSRFLSECYLYLQGLAAATPNEWIFRIRVAAVVLICYALYRLVSRRFDMAKLERELVQARQTLKELQPKT